MKTIVLMLFAIFYECKVHAQTKTLHSNHFNQTLKVLQGEQLSSENFRLQKSPSIDKLLLFRKYSLAKIEKSLKNEGWQYISSEKNDGVGVATFTYNSYIDSKAWYKLIVGFAEDPSQKFGNYISFEHDSKTINKTASSRLIDLGYQLKSVTSDKTSLVKFFYDSTKNVFVMLSSYNTNVGSNFRTKYINFLGLLPPHKRDSVNNLPTLKIRR